MTTEIETTFHTQDNVRIHISEWDGDGSAWIRISTTHSSMSSSLTRVEAEQFIAGLQAVLNKEVAA